LTEDATGSNGTGGEPLARALAAAHDALAAKLALLEAEQAAGSLTAVQAAVQARAARTVYDRDRGLAEIAAETGWETWVGTLPHLLYARRPLTSPAWVVRAPDPAALREAIEAYERGGRLAP
jgi:hypothetical protein